MASTNPARGMRDFLPADVRKRNYVINIIKEVYESYGFEPLETPSVENLETLMGKYGDEGNQLVFKILKRGEKLDEALATGGNASVNERGLSDLALRYDLTVPLARVVANNKNDLPKFFKRYQIQPVWRADRPARGRFREFYQCDVDCIGSASTSIEVEQISAISDILLRLGFQPLEFKMNINHRDVIFGLLDQFGVPQEAQLLVLTEIDKLDKSTLEAIRAKLDDAGVPREAVGGYLAFMTHISKTALTLDQQSPREANSYFLEELEKVLATHERGRNALKVLSGILEIAEASSARNQILISPWLARGLSYYTGSIMELFVAKETFAGSLGGGGRYDGLIGMFGKEQIPACGFSLGLERILVVMEEREMFPPEIAESTPADVMVTIWSDETVADSLKLANELRAQGVRVTMYPQADKEDKQWKYANSIGVPWICTVNQEDIDEGVVSFQNLRTREKYREPVSKVSAKIKEQTA